jgi:hypothetical protein
LTKNAAITSSAPAVARAPPSPKAAANVSVESEPDAP